MEQEQVADSRSSAPPNMEEAAPPDVQEAAHLDVEEAVPLDVQEAAPPDVQEAAPPDVQEAVMPDVEEAAPPDVQEAAPPDVQEAVMPDVEKAAHLDVQEAAPLDVQEAAPLDVQEANSRSSPGPSNEEADSRSSAPPDVEEVLTSPSIDEAAGPDVEEAAMANAEEVLTSPSVETESPPLSFNLIIATVGRPSLQRMIDSIASQLRKEDYLTVIWDKGFGKDELRINSECTVIHIENPSPLGAWGHGSRTKWQSSLPGDYHMNGDDDDIFTPNAMQDIRHHCKEDKLYIFKMKLRKLLIPGPSVLKRGNIGTPCGVYRPHHLPPWPSKHGGDFDFYKALSGTRPVQFVNKVIYKVRNS